MNNSLPLRVATFLAFVPCLAAGEALAAAGSPDLLNLVAGKGWTLSAGYRAERIDKEGKPGVRIVDDGSGKAPKYAGATAQLVDASFESGEIEVDIQGPQGTDLAFVGLAFRIQPEQRPGEQKMDLVYFRPQKFGKAKKPGDLDGEVQYSSEPTFSWYVTRKLVPGKYEKNLPNAPKSQAAWFHARIAVDGAKVRVFVDGAQAPCLVVDDALGGKTSGGLGLWTWPGGSFANLKITPRSR